MEKNPQKRVSFLEKRLCSKVVFPVPLAPNKKKLFVLENLQDL